MTIDEPAARRPGATPQQVAALVEQLLPLRLPGALVELLRRSDGFLTAGGINVYGTDDVRERNATYEVPEF